MGPPSVPPTGLTTADLRYVGAVAVTVVAIGSQYFVPQMFPAARAIYGNLPGGLAVVYGIPVVAFALLVGAGPLRGWKSRMAAATWQGFRWYGAMLTLALVVLVVLVSIYLAYDPSALNYLNRPNPALEEGAANPWFFVGFSFVIGAFEEAIFRGWIFGYWSGRSSSWFVPAVGSSALFAGVHLYYGITYGPAAPLIFPSLFLTGFAFAATFQASRGNLVVIALLHGASDGSAYLTLISTPTGLLIHYLLILVGLIVAVADLFLRHERGGVRWSAREINEPPLPWQGAEPGASLSLEARVRSTDPRPRIRWGRTAAPGAGRQRHVTGPGPTPRWKDPTTPPRGPFSSGRARSRS